MANLLAISHFRRVDTLGVRISISGDSKLTLAPPRPVVQRKLRIGTVAKATTGTPVQNISRREDIEEQEKQEEWEKSPYERVVHYIASFLPTGPCTIYYVDAALNYLGIFWLFGVPWLGSILPFIPWSWAQIMVTVGFISYAARIYNWLCEMAILRRRQMQCY